ncbi:hypothetical protein ACLK2H_12845 [Escherichia coli]
MTAGSIHRASAGSIASGQNARAGAGIDKGLLIAEVIVRQSDKQAAGGFNAVAGDAA